MPEELEGNCLIAQSGGPTSVINASLAGAVAVDGGGAAGDLAGPGSAALRAGLRT